MGENKVRWFEKVRIVSDGESVVGENGWVREMELSRGEGKSEYLYLVRDYKGELVNGGRG